MKLLSTKNNDKQCTCENLRTLNLKWWLKTCIACIVLLLIYIVLQDGSSRLYDVISIGSAITSIVLGIVAIVYSIIVNNNTSNKEHRIHNMLENIEKSVGIINAKVDEVKYYSIKTNNLLINQKEKLRDSLNSISEEELEKDNKELESLKLDDLKQSPIKQESKDIQDSGITMSKYYEGILHKGMLVNYQCTKNGCRPGLIVSDEVSNEKRNTVSLIPISSKIKESHLITRIPINNLPVHSYAVIEAMSSIDKKDIIDVLGKVDKDTLKKVNIAIMTYLGIDEI